jgi:2-dehydropantoate 2-reductase
MDFREIGVVMRVLVVGAGAIGQVIGHHLSVGGSQVSVLLRADGQASDEPYRLHRLRRGRRPLTATWLPRESVRGLDALPDARWDAVLLCVPSDVLRHGWLPVLAERVGRATIVSTGQDPGDLAILRGVWTGTQVVQATPGLFAYHAPLSNRDQVRSGIAYWLPPGPNVRFSGEAERVRPLITVLSRGPFSASEAAVGSGELRAAMTQPYIAMLSTLDWSVRGLRQQVALPTLGAREAATVTAAMYAMAPPGRLGVSATLARVALRALPTLVPFDLHRYLRVHFSKLSEQTEQMIDGWIAEGRERSLPVAGLEALRARTSLRSRTAGGSP